MLEFELSNLAKSVVKWMAENKWLNETPEDNDFSSEYFYNFFRKKEKGLTPEKLDDALWELRFEELIESKCLDDEDDYKIDIIRGLTAKGFEYYNKFLK